MRAVVRVSTPLLIASLLFTPLCHAADDDPDGGEDAAEWELPAAEPAPIEASRDEEQRPSRRKNWKRNTGMMVGGIVCTSLGGLGLFIGSISLALSSARNTTVCDGGSCRPATEDDREGLRTAGWVGFIGGAVLAGVGIPLIISGAKRRPIHQAMLSAPVQLLVGPTGGGVRVAF